MNHVITVTMQLIKAAPWHCTDCGVQHGLRDRHDVKIICSKCNQQFLKYDASLGVIEPDIPCIGSNL